MLLKITTEEILTSSRAHRRGLAASVIALGIGLAVAPLASADPGDPFGGDPVTPAPAAGYADAGPVEISVPPTDDAGPAATACPNFAAALDAASTYYGDFADTIDGSPRPDYSDPSVSMTSESGRTALRQAASLAMTSAGTPGLQPDVADPMRSWSFGATKLLLKMAVRTSGDSMNQTAAQMNTDATNAQMACVGAGSRA